MVKISTNVGNIQIDRTTHHHVSKSHDKIFKDHFKTAPKNYCVINGIINDPSQELIINANFSNAKKESLIFVALIDELGEYLSRETLEAIKESINIDLKVSQKQIESKQITLLIAKQLIDGSITNAKVYYLNITDIANIETRAEKIQRG